MSNYVALDIGNVLCRINLVNFINVLSKTLNISILDAEHRINRYQKMHDVGLFSIRDILESEFGIKSKVIIDELSNEWKDIVKFDIATLDYFHDFNLKYELRIALLSNIGFEHAEFIRPFLNKYNSTFEEAIEFFSCNVGVRKPNYLYFQSFLQQCPDFEGCVYVDDREENIETSKLFNFKPYKFDLNNIHCSPEVLAPSQFFINSVGLKNELDKIGELILDSSKPSINSRWH